VPLRAVLQIQSELVVEHGGLPGPPRLGDLEAALGRPPNLHAYQKRVTLAELAAAYGYALARCHAFPDGNKRVAFAVMDVFLRMNGMHLTADELEAATTIEQLAAGELDEPALARWVERHATALPG
jgi:death on curing protein